MQLPERQEDAAVQLLLGAFLASVRDVATQVLGDAEAAAAVVAAAPTAVTVTPQADGTLLYQFTAKLPASYATAVVAQRRLRRLQDASGSDPFSNMLTDGTLTQNLLQAGVSNAQELLESGALGVAAAVEEPSRTSSITSSQSPSPSPSPSTVGATGAVQLGGLPASAFVAGRLTPAAATSIETALTAGLAAACPACTVRVTRVVDSTSGAEVWYAAGRRLAGGTYTVTYFVGGAGAAGGAAAVAGLNTAIVANSLSGALQAPITVALAGASGGAAAGGSSLSAGGAVGVAVASLLIFAALLACICYQRKQRREGGGKLTNLDLPPESPGLMIRGPLAPA